MNEKQFYDAADTLFLHVEDWLEKSGIDLEFESQEGILSIILPEGSQIILSRQAALQEIWLASKKGAFHFRRCAGDWQSGQGHSLLKVLENMVLDANTFSS